MKIDVIVITYGEPAKASFGAQWRYSNRILSKLTRLVAPIPKFAVPLFGAWRGYNRAKTWRSEQYHSPMEPVTERQYTCIKRELEDFDDGNQWRVHLAYEFRDPDLNAVLTRLLDDPGERLIFAPIYLAKSDFTSEISRRDFNRFQEKHGNTLPEARTVTFRECHHDLAQVMADFIRQQVAGRGLTPEQCKQTGLLLGCHGTVVQPPPGIEDAGYCDTKQMYDDLEELLHDEFQAVAIGWLNHRLGGEWTTPTLETSARAMLEQGITRFVYYPFGFLADNAETELEGRVALRDLGITAYHHLPCLNDDPAFMRFVAARIVEEALKDE